MSRLPRCASQLAKWTAPVLDALPGPTLPAALHCVHMPRHPHLGRNKAPVRPGGHSPKPPTAQKTLRSTGWLTAAARAGAPTAPPWHWPRPGMCTTWLAGLWPSVLPTWVRSGPHRPDTWPPDAASCTQPQAAISRLLAVTQSQPLTLMQLRAISAHSTTTAYWSPQTGPSAQLLAAPQKPSEMA